MQTINFDIVIIGGGPAGMAAALQARKSGADSVLIIDRNAKIGGILHQCIHDGFGLLRYGESLTGPEYVRDFQQQINDDSSITVWCKTSVIELHPDKSVVCMSRKGLFYVKAKAIILSTGCRERTRGAISIPGTRPSGIYTAGLAQQYINQINVAIGKRAVILGSGDIGLIMARRLTLEGMEVACVLEKMPYCNGLPRNVVQCLDDFGIELRVSQTVTNIRGSKRLEAVDVHSVDADGVPIPGTQYSIDCDTLILSVGLIPENEIAKQAGIAIDPVTNGAIVSNRLETSISGIFACGNALHVHDLADYASDEGEIAGKWACEYILGRPAGQKTIRVAKGQGVRYVVPQKITDEQDVIISFRADAPYTNKRVLILADGGVLLDKKYESILPSEMMRLHLKNIPADAKAIEVKLIDQ